MKQGLQLYKKRIQVKKYIDISIYISEYYWSEHMSILRLGLTCACFFLPSHL